jgi:hypothetical protein
MFEGTCLLQIQERNNRAWFLVLAVLRSCELLRPGVLRLYNNHSHMALRMEVRLVYLRDALFELGVLARGK